MAEIRKKSQSKASTSRKTAVKSKATGSKAAKSSATKTPAPVAAKTGGCLCGDNRYEITAAAVDTHHCHCSICRRLQGAAFVTLSIFPRSAFRWTQGGSLDTFDSSSKVHRHRCKRCGAPLTITFEGHESFAPLIAVMRAGLDKDVKPDHPKKTLRHAFWPDRVRWLALEDSVRHTKGFA